MMKRPSNPRATLIILLESALWIFASLYTRRLLDLAAVQWQIHEPWITLIKIAVVLTLIAIAVALHGLLFRWLKRLGQVQTDPED